MATINMGTLDAQRRTPFYTTGAQGALQVLPFELVSIDYDDQFYELVPGTLLDANQRPRRGVMTAPVIVSRNGSLPRAKANERQDEHGVFEYHGI